MNAFLQQLLVDNPGLLNDQDFAEAAEELACEVACVRAVTEVEAGSGGGFLPSGRPKILFEAHVFSRLTGHRYDRTHTHISSRQWNKALYKGGELEYQRLEQAMALDATAALQSASWGLFQIMGFHHQACGYGSVEAFVAAQFESEGHHLQAFIDFLKSMRLDSPLRTHDWAKFAKGYNGAEYAKNDYDGKLAKAYRRACARGHG
jgi:hypothetical protein